MAMYWYKCRGPPHLGDTITDWREVVKVPPDYYSTLPCDVPHTVLPTSTKNTFFLNTYIIDFVIVFGAIALISWPSYARIIRGQILSIKQQLYVEAAISMGSNLRHLMKTYLIPNSIGPVVVAVTQGIGGAILLESSLSFLGVGVQPPNASWGSMLSDSLTLWRSYPHLMIIPAVTIGIIQIAFIFLGDGINDALNPKQTIR